MDLPVLVSFSLYMVIMLGIGIYFYIKTDDLSDYVLGGRGLGPFVTALSAGASDMSGWLLLGLPGMMYSQGLVGSWIALGLTVGAFLNWHYVAKPLRSYTFHLDNAITIPDYFSNRFEDNKNHLRIITAVVILVFYTLYTSSGLVGGAKLFEATFNMDYQTALFIGSVIIVSYTFLGGYNAVSWTDLIQGILMMLALVVTPLAVIYELGGVGSAIDAVTSIDPLNVDVFRGASFISIISLLAWGLGYFGQPHILVRFMSIKNTHSLGTAKKVCMTWMVASVLGSLATGFFGLAYIVGNEIALDDSEKIFITLSQLLFNPWIAGFLLAAILAAIMSTVDSQLLVSSSVLTRDLYHVLIRKDATDRELVWVGRATVMGIAIIAWAISTNKDSSVLKLVANAWAGFGAAFGPVIILSLYHKGISKSGAIAGMVSGSLTVLIWQQLEGGIFELYELLPGFVISAICTVAFSQKHKVSEKMTQTFHKVHLILKTASDEV